MARGVELVFRPMQPEDLEPCVDLYRTIFREPPWYEDWKHSTARQRLEEIFGAPHRFCFGGWEGKDLAAFCLGRLVTRADRASAQIEEFGLDPRVASPEAGKAMLRFALERLAERGVRSIFSMLHTGNPCLEFFHRAGFHLSRHYAVLIHRMED